MGEGADFLAAICKLDSADIVVSVATVSASGRAWFDTGFGAGGGRYSGFGGTASFNGKEDAGPDADTDASMFNNFPNRSSNSVGSKGLVK